MSPGSIPIRHVIFDMDGVLVDESSSYREAIRLTCESFGVSVTMDEIARQKLCGDANNDWEFTDRLLREKGVDADFPDIKSRFESFYQGDDSRDGLWKTEKQLVDHRWLIELNRRIKLGIVTGRPRHDAARFLENSGLQDCFETLICLEDGPAKPDPANVKTALKRLGTNYAWMIGDTPDDVLAARRAGVVPIGIAAPNDDPVFAAEQLNAAHASMILDDLKTLDEYLP